MLESWIETVLCAFGLPNCLSPTSNPHWPSKNIGLCLTVKEQTNKLFATVPAVEICCLRLRITTAAINAGRRWRMAFNYCRLIVFDGIFVVHSVCRPHTIERHTYFHGLASIYIICDPEYWFIAHPSAEQVSEPALPFQLLHSLDYENALADSAALSAQRTADTKRPQHLSSPRIGESIFPATLEVYWVVVKCAHRVYRGSRLMSKPHNLTLKEHFINIKS